MSDAFIFDKSVVTFETPPTEFSDLTSLNGDQTYTGLIYKPQFYFATAPDSQGPIDGFIDMITMLPGDPTPPPSDDSLL